MRPTVRETVIFGVLGAIMCASDIAMEMLPNIHIIGVIIVAATVVFRAKALYAIFVYVMLLGAFSGFQTWWLPYLYIWLPLWGGVMLLPRKIPEKIRPIVYMCACALHGFLFGVLYAPFQAVVFGLSFKSTLAWIAAGMPFDIIHGVANFVCGTLICPIIAVLRRSLGNR